MGESQILLFCFEREGKMTRKISGFLSPSTFLYCLCCKRLFILYVTIEIPANVNTAYWGNIVYSSMIRSQATSYLLSLVGRAALSFVTYLSIMATHGPGKG